MSRLKKISLCMLVFVCLLGGLVAILDSVGRTGRISPASVPQSPDPFGAGVGALDRGEHEVALAYFLQVPKGDRNFSRAQRYIGWEMYGDAMGRPLAGLRYVNRALLDDPFSSNSWEDAGRAYAAALFSKGEAVSPGATVGAGATEGEGD